MNKRGFIGGLGALVAAPAVICSGILMPLRGVIMRLVATSIIYGPDDAILATNPIYADGVVFSPDEIMWNAGDLAEGAMREVVTFTKPFDTGSVKLHALRRELLPVGIVSAWTAEKMVAPV